jgi:hypothetical protein
MEDIFEMLAGLRKAGKPAAISIVTSRFSSKRLNKFGTK